LPLDVVGGAALGLAVDAVIDRILPVSGADHAALTLVQDSDHYVRARTTNEGLGLPS
jgi:hypothetical protein